MKNATQRQSNRSFLECSDLKGVFFDNNKINYYSDNVVLGIRNYALFQKYSYFYWPSWLTNYNDKGEIVHSPSPPILYNDSLRNGIVFTNYISQDEVFIDPSGMLSPSYASWSVEVWLKSGEELFRPAYDLQNITLERNPKNGLAISNWTRKAFKLQQTVYAAFENNGELIADIDVHIMQKIKQPVLMLVVRPYNYEKIGGLTSVQYNGADSSVTINGNKCIAMDKPDFVYTGNSKVGDISLDNAESDSTTCSRGMATMACLYKIKSQKSSINFRISLTPGKKVFSTSLDNRELQKSFISKSTEVITSGINVAINDTLFNNWLYASKISALNFTDNDLYSADNAFDAKAFYYIVLAYNRMGYYNEALRLIELVNGRFKTYEKNRIFDYIINVSYLIIAITDYYSHSRDFDYLQLQYEVLRGYAANLFKLCSKIKKIDHFTTNSLRELYIPEAHPYDFILIAGCFENLAYLARCMGIFGDEKKYLKEAGRFQSMFVDHVFNNKDNKVAMSEFYCYNVYCGFPFHIEMADNKKVKFLLDRIKDNNNNNYLIYNRSLGLDVLSTLVVANNLLYLKKSRAIEVVENLLKLGRKRYVLPQFINPTTGNGCWGDGASKIISSVVFMTLRNLLYIDKVERLELFPVPKTAWFKPGKEINISNAPSRFGYLDIKVVNTTNEVQIHFNSLPKYVPPDILINLPFKAKIVKGDDYIIKKEEDKSFIINGWPSLVRLIKK